MEGLAVEADVASLEREAVPVHFPGKFRLS